MFLPPEMFKRVRIYPENQDIWAFGIILYMFLFTIFFYNENDELYFQQFIFEDENEKFLTWCEYGKEELLFPELEGDYIKDKKLDTANLKKKKLIDIARSILKRNSDERVKSMTDIIEKLHDIEFENCFMNDARRFKEIIEDMEKPYT